MAYVSEYDGHVVLRWKGQGESTMGNDAKHDGHVVPWKWQRVPAEDNDANGTKQEGGSSPTSRYRSSHSKSHSDDPTHRITDYECSTLRVAKYCAFAGAIERGTSAG